MFDDYNELVMHSGNMLDIDELKQKTGVKSSDELLDVMKIVLERGKTIPGEKTLEVYNITGGNELVDAQLLYTNVKLFLKTPTKEAVISAIETLKTVLYNISLDSVIIWYPNEMKGEPTEELLKLWSVLGEYVLKKKVVRLGIADVDTDVFISLYDKVEVKPEIFHLNVQNCCLVPPELQKFAEEKEIQLLTHYDPPDIMPEGNMIAELKNFKPYWIARYQSHIKCRGVLAKKGYLLSLRQII
uniref:GCS light chain n=1 Tax=Riptortus pedestris TaxID=329032 RepID=R4WDJ4_RIPPE|nr:gamma-glutamylcysteine synthetase, putative [Riptortus pedestris]